MKILRKMLFPFSIIYDLVTTIRNILYDKTVFKSHSFDIPVIAVGNLSVGGTGKTPQIEYLIRLLSNKYNLATLSRGYKRKSKEYILADSNCTAQTIGDEPFQFFNKFKNILVAVDSDRKNGIDQLLSNTKKIEIILLDDAFQHRKVKAGFYILLTAFNDFFLDDFILPAGNLRESKRGINRANMIVITKCPPNLSDFEQKKIKKKVGGDLPIFFSSIEYDTIVYNDNQNLAISEIMKNEKILLAGIAKPKPFFDFLKTENDTLLSFGDHHNFSDKEILEIKSISKDKKIITTEKDYVRLKDSILKNQLFYLPIKTKLIVNNDVFDKIILDFVENFNSSNKN